MERICSEPECGNKFYCRGLCELHYNRRRKAKALDGLPRLTARHEATADERLKHNGWTVTESGCWEWNGQRGSNGYGRISLGVHRRMQIASRVAYETWVGPIPDGLYICHRCDNPPCINPGHLFVGTPLDNVADMVEKERHRWRERRTHCTKGHELTPENTYKRVRSDRPGVTRLCRICMRINCRRSYANRKQVRELSPSFRDVSNETGSNGR